MYTVYAGRYKVGSHKSEEKAIKDAEFVAKGEPGVVTVSTNDGKGLTTTVAQWFDGERQI